MILRTEYIDLNIMQSSVLVDINGIESLIRLGTRYGYRVGM
jgi:hypothetical protein